MPSPRESRVFISAVSGELKSCRSEVALAGYGGLLARNPDDIQARLFSVVPLWRLGELKGKAGLNELEAALAVLEP